MTRRVWALLVAVALGLVGPMIASGAQGPQRSADQITHATGGHAAPPLRSGVDLVALSVDVRGLDGRFVSGLSAQDFVILDDGRQQRASLFLRGDDIPVAVILLIDRSSSMGGVKLERAKAAASAFIDALRPNDLVEVMAFNQDADRAVPLGADHEAAARALAPLFADGQTALYEAVLVSTHELEHARRQLPGEYRRAIVVLSDGEDTASLISFEDVLEQIRRSDIIFYPVSVRADDKRRWLPAPFDLAQLAFDSGGRAVAVQDADALSAIYDAIRSELQHLYMLGYVPDRIANDGRWHTIKIRLPGRNAAVRTRSGYYAAKSVDGSTKR